MFRLRSQWQHPLHQIQRHCMDSSQFFAAPLVTTANRAIRLVQPGGNTNTSITQGMRAGAIPLRGRTRMGIADTRKPKPTSALHIGTRIIARTTVVLQCYTL